MKSTLKTLKWASPALVLAAMFIIAMAYPLPYVVQSAGPTLNVLGTYEDKEIITVEGHEEEDTDGELRLTTVSVKGAPGTSVHLSDVFLAWFDPTQSVLPVEALYPDTSDVVGNQLMNTVEMNSSQDEAVAAALREQGIDVKETIIVAGVRSDGPANGILEAGDKVLALNGVTKSRIEEYVQITGVTPEGESVEMTIERDGKEMILQVPTRHENGRSMMGIILSRGFDLPVKVDFAIDGIGGPSAGMIFALAIIDEMTPGALTGGKHIAGTGTITEEGAVGPIGGIRQKLVGAKNDGAEFFLAPASNCDDVVGHVPDGLSVVRVSTLTDALDAVKTIASTGSTNDLPTCGN